MKATNKSTGFIMVYLQYLLYCNRVMNKSGNHYGDSTPLPVCHNYNIYRHKVHKGFADRGKSTKGWFYGFKLHGICNGNSELEKLCFSSGNVYDNQIIEDLLVDDITGSVTFDAGYLLKEEILEKVFTSNRKVYIATRKNMKRLMTGEQMRQFRARSKIETLWGIIFTASLLLCCLGTKRGRFQCEKLEFRPK